MKIKACFKGEDGSLGFVKGKDYHLTISILSTRARKRIRIESCTYSNMNCEYENMLKFFENWTNIITEL